MTETARAIRPFEARDESAVAGVWYRSGRSAYTFLPAWQTLTLERAQEIFRNVIRPTCDIWVGTLHDQVVAYLAMKASYIDRMYVDPTEWRKGWGGRLVALAKALSPNGLELHTHQENRAARALYEKHGFLAVRFGISPPPECPPDVEYHWRPSNTRLQAAAPSGISGAAVVINSTLAKKNATASDPWAMEWLKSNEAGGGAYRLESWKPGTETVDVRSDDWKSGPLPKIKRVIAREVPSAGRKCRASRAG